MKWIVLVCLIAGMGIQPLTARAQACGEVNRGDRTDAVLPAGFRDTSWGMSRAAVQAVRGREMVEHQDLTLENVYTMFEELTDGKGVAAVHYTFYDDRLMSVVLFLNPGTIEISESILVGDFQGEFGKEDHHSVEELDERDVKKGARTHPDKNWIWCDRFTEQTLKRRPEKGEVLLIRQSRYIYDDLLHQVTSDRNQQDFDVLHSLDTK